MKLQSTITIAGNSTKPIIVSRLGYGTMRLTGKEIYGEPPNRNEALQILKEAADSGIQFFDTADYYGEDVTNRLIAEALYPYPEGMVICTKVGATRKPDKSWVVFNSPANIRQSIENNLRTLRIGYLQLVHFRVIPGSDIPFTQSMDTMFKLQQEGKILHVGVSNVNEEELTTAMKMGAVATVENMYGHAQRTTLINAYGANRGGEEILDICEDNEIPLIPYFSLFNALSRKNERIALIAKKYDASDAQVNIAWLLHRSPWILPIPGTSSLAHFRENLQSAAINLSEEDLEYLN